MKNLILLMFVIATSLALSGCGKSPTTVPLTIQVEGQGLVDPLVGSGQYQKQTALSVVAVADEGWEFSHWKGEVAEPHRRQTTVLVDRQKTITAVFVESGVPLVEAPGGLITRRRDGSWVASRPNQADDIEYIVLHAISDARENPTNPFQMNRIRAIFDDYSVEAHYVIDRQGAVHQFVDDQLIARHAGAGSWAGDPRLTNGMNQYSLGIELLGIGTKAEMANVIGRDANNRVRQTDRGYTNEQYTSLRQLTNHLMDQYAIPKENIIGHDDYDPGRKWDPGALFDWSRLDPN